MEAAPSRIRISTAKLCRERSLPKPEAAANSRVRPEAPTSRDPIFHGPQARRADPGADQATRGAAPIISATANTDPTRRDYFKPDLFNGHPELTLSSAAERRPENGARPGLRARPTRRKPSRRRKIAGGPSGAGSCGWRPRTLMGLRMMNLVLSNRPQACKQADVL